MWTYKWTPRFSFLLLQWMQLSWCLFFSRAVWLELSGTLSWPPSARNCTVWLTHDGWLVYGSRHRWARSLNLPLSQEPPPTPTIFNNIVHLISLHVCGFLHLRSFFSTGFAPALNIQFLPNWGMKKRKTLSAAVVHTFSFPPHQHTPSAGLIHGEEG